MIDRIPYVYKFASGNRSGTLQKEIPDFDWNPARPAMYTFYETGMPPIKMTEKEVRDNYGGLDLPGLLKIIGLL